VTFCAAAGIWAAAANKEIAAVAIAIDRIFRAELIGSSRKMT
jgi:hypothetical protein